MALYIIPVIYEGTKFEMGECFDAKLLCSDRNLVTISFIGY